MFTETSVKCEIFERYRIKKKKKKKKKKRVNLHGILFCLCVNEMVL